MKRNLGRILMLWVLMGGTLFAKYEWKLLGSPKSLYVGQSGLVTYQCAFDNSAADYTISFHPQNSQTYKASMLTQKDKIVDGKRIQTFEVLITPIQAGNVNVKLNALVRHTTFASIENATIGRDNVKKYDFKDDNVTMPPVSILAKENLAALNGQFDLRMEIDKTSVRTHEPVHLSLFVKGKGNLDQFIPFELSFSGINVFKEEPIKNLTLTSEGYEGEIRQEFALVAEKSYTIPSIQLKVFDTLKQKVVILKTEPMFIEVTQGYEPSSLLDPPQFSDHNALKRYIIYLLWFIGGVVSAIAFPRLWKQIPRRRQKFFYDDAKSPNELMVLLALHDSSRYGEVIRALEEKRFSVREAKKRLLKIDRVN